MTQPVTTTLDCGVTLAVEPIGSAQSAALTWLTPAGSAADPSARVGLSAMLEELLLRGAAGRTSKEQADAYDLLGASRGTAVQTSHLSFDSVFLGSRAGDVLTLAARTLREPAFDPDDTEPARQLALQALQGLEDNPSTRVMLAAREHHAPSPLNRSGMGTPEGLAAITRDDLVAHWNATALPVGTVIALAGAIDPARAADTLSAALDGWAGTAPELTWSGTGPRGYHHIPTDNEQVHIAVIHDAPEEASDDAVLERLAVAVLSGGMSGRLFTEVREKRGLCYAVSAGYATAKDYGRVVSYSGTTPERAQETLDVLTAELRRINTPEGAVTPDELDRARVGLKSKLIMSGESTSARAAAIASDTVRLGAPRSLETVAQQIDAVTLDQLNAYLARRDLGTLTACTLGPAELTFSN